MKKDSRSLFDFIAYPYTFFFAGQYRHNLVGMDRYRQMLPKDAKTLDIGCGTGSFSAMLADNGFSVTGVDFSQKMIAEATRINKKRKIEFLDGNFLEDLPFADKSFDLVTASYVLHGLKSDERMRFYREAKRVARQAILIQDYGTIRKPMTDLIEWIEGGDYFNFIRVAENEMLENFESVTLLPTEKQTIWYLLKI